MLGGRLTPRPQRGNANAARSTSSPRQAVSRPRLATLRQLRQRAPVPSTGADYAAAALETELTRRNDLVVIRPPEAGPEVGSCPGRRSPISRIWPLPMEAPRGREDAFRDATGELLISKSRSVRSPTGCGRTTRPSSAATCPRSRWSTCSWMRCLSRCAGAGDTLIVLDRDDGLDAASGQVRPDRMGGVGLVGQHGVGPCPGPPGAGPGHRDLGESDSEGDRVVPPSHGGDEPQRPTPAVRSEVDLGRQLARRTAQRLPLDRFPLLSWAIGVGSRRLRVVRSSPQWGREATGHGCCGSPPAQPPAARWASPRWNASSML